MMENDENILVELKQTKNKFSFDEPDWEERRFECAMNLMVTLLKEDRLTRNHVYSATTFEDMADVAVRCADALIEELQKER